MQLVSHSCIKSVSQSVCQHSHLMMCQQSAALTGHQRHAIAKSTVRVWTVCPRACTAPVGGRCSHRCQWRGRLKRKSYVVKLFLIFCGLQFIVWITCSVSVKLGKTPLARIPLVMAQKVLVTGKVMTPDTVMCHSANTSELYYICGRLIWTAAHEWQTEWLQLWNVHYGLERTAIIALSYTVGSISSQYNWGIWKQVRVIQSVVHLPSQ